MSEFIERQKPIIERSGLGLLPGIAIALFISMGLIAAIATDRWWVVVGVLAGIFIVTSAVVAVIFGLLGSEEDIYSQTER